jgi:pilus assembly protein Flp/PilA
MTLDRRERKWSVYGIFIQMGKSPRWYYLGGAAAMWGKFLAFVKCESGATAIEYGLIAAGISVAVIAVVNGLGSKLNTKFSSISTQLK